MGTTLHTLSAPPGATRKAKRIGRGPGSGTGKTSGKGVKGQKARTGHHGARRGFEGGQMPLQRRLPKKGFKNFFRVEYHVINISDLEKRCPPGSIDADTLKNLGLVPRSCSRIKVLGKGETKKKFSVKLSAFSASAKQKIEQAGGKVEVLGAGNVPPAAAQV